MEEKASLIENKKQHPLERANVISQAFFCWMLPFFVKGFKKELTEDDLYRPLKTHESKRLGDRLEQAWDYQVAHKKNPSLLMAIFKVFRVEFALYGVLYLIQQFIVKLSHPLLISKFLTFYDPKQTDVYKDEVYTYAVLIVLFALFNVMCVHGYYFCVMHLGMKIRIATCSLIYRKILKLNRTALERTTVGQMVNLLSNDVGRFDFATQYLHNLWVVPFETAIVMYLLYVYVGLTGLTGAFFLVLFIFPQMYIGEKTSKYRLSTAQCTDERVRLMSEIIHGIQVIKMYTWEKPFAKLVEISRRKEMKQIWATAIMKAITITCVSVLYRTAVYLCILTYVLTGNIITASYAYTVASFYAIFRQSITMFLPRAVMQTAEARVSVRRIEAFLSHEEITSSNGNNNFSPTNIQNGSINRQSFDPETVGIRLKDISVKLDPNVSDNTLERITFEANSSQLVAIVGTVGGGKTTLLHTILKELTPMEGAIDVDGTISYASQDPWLFGGSIRQNIVFGQKFNSEKYSEVVKVCDLEKDFELLPYGDETLVGARGVTLSGGQRARINLARAVYKRADIYLLDDPLSAVDSGVGKHLFDECICGYLKGKCVVLVTNQLQYLKKVHIIYLVQNGKIQAKGSYDQLKETGIEFTKLLIEHKEEEEEKLNAETNTTLKGGGKKNQDKEKPVQEREKRGAETISQNVYKVFMQAGGNWCKAMVVLVAFLLAQVIATLADYFITVWVNLEQWRSQNGLREDDSMKNSFNDTSTYNDTFSRTNNTHNGSFTGSIQNTLHLMLTEENAIIIYSVLVITSVVIALGRTLSFFRYCITASTRLHNLMFSKLVKAPMRFFNTNPPGRIQNRFSKDIGTIDETLPPTIADAVQIALILLSVSVVVGCLNPWILIPTVLIVIIFYYLRLVFLATSRDLKRVEAVTRSPMYTHVTSSVQGITTIRAFGAQEILKNEFENHQNLYTSASFMFLGANRTFGFWLDFHCVIYTALVIISILFIKNEIFGGNVGYALTEAVGLTGMFQWGIRQWSEMENQMTAVERVQEYIEITPEKDEKIKEPPKFWPDNGHIIFSKVCLRYSEDSPYVLNEITFIVKPKAKIGIVGRTGAGKSSIIAALFRLTDITQGTILLDDINIRNVPLDTLRSKISIIPQEPVLFSGTLRNNLDPFDEFSEDVIWNALENVELKKTVEDLPSCLEYKISEGGTNFSVGQRQLTCLARAIIRNNKILVLDEATANVDPYTDGLIQTTIRKKFSDCTVLTIAHRLHSIMDSDKVLVMDDGRVVEYDHPHKLLQNPNGVFYGLIRETGKAMAENLTATAEKYYREQYSENTL